MDNANKQLPIAKRYLRSGFTLVELMLVLAVLAVFAAMAWPSIHRAYESVLLKDAAQQVQAAFGHARVQAMTSGVSQVFHFEQGTSQYTISALQDDTAATESDSTSDSTAVSTMTLGGNSPAASAGTSNASGDASAGCAYQLPDGFTFTSGNRVLDARAAAAESEASGNSSSDNAPPVLFYPDGTASEAVVTISNQYGRNISISLRGLTGVARMSDIFSGEAPQ
ncbi:MAG TPA: prepilin-type N-terminal cleavage/methylation domain-containing protein [Pirellulales bacterium]|nr:prepilin-type N-terminal cleavage/methylation domain-containing protein [Pirellulales bacterium]